MYSDRDDYKNPIFQDRIKPENNETKPVKNNNKQKTDERYSNNPEIIHIQEEQIIDLSTVDNVVGKLTFLPNYLNEKEAEDLYAYLVENINWKQREGVNKFGDKYYEPRKTCWFGKPYKYSSVAWDENEEWDVKIKELRIRLTEDHPISQEKEYNSVMCNYYRDKNDSIGWHADDETSLGRFPKIASISLGSERVFEVCKRNEYYNRNNNTNSSKSVFDGCTILYKFHLNPGSLLIMEGPIQEEWLHRVPKEYNEMDGRINLTYRYIVSEEEENAEIQRRKELKEKRNKYSSYNRNKSANNSDEICGFPKERKISNKIEKEYHGEYFGNRNRSDNYYNNRHVKRENNYNNYSDQKCYNKCPRKLHHSQIKCKREYVDKCTDREAKDDYIKFSKSPSYTK